MLHLFRDSETIFDVGCCCCCCCTGIQCWMWGMVMLVAWQVIMLLVYLLPCIDVFRARSHSHSFWWLHSLAVGLGQVRYRISFNIATYLIRNEFRIVYTNILILWPTVAVSNFKFCPNIKWGEEIWLKQTDEKTASHFEFSANQQEKTKIKPWNHRTVLHILLISISRESIRWEFDQRSGNWPHFCDASFDMLLFNASDQSIQFIRYTFCWPFETTRFIVWRAGATFCISLLRLQSIGRPIRSGPIPNCV